MLVNFFNSQHLKRDYKLSFSFRHSALYAEGVARHIHTDALLYPVYFPDFSSSSPFSKNIPLFARRYSLAFARLALFWPLLLLEVFVLFRLIKRLSPDILHINNGGYPAAFSARAAAIAGYLAGVPATVMVVNNMAEGYRNYSRWMDYPVDRLVVRAVKVFVTGSTAASNKLQKVLRLPSSKLTRIHNGMALRKTTEDVADTRQRLGLAGFDGVVFGVVALLIPRKGHQGLLDAVLQLVNKNLTLLPGNFVVLIEGEGPLLQHLTAFVQQKNLAGFVRFVGVEGNVVNFMRALDVLVLPSVSNEDFPNVVIEAMALGKPVIASRLAGTPEQVSHGVTGLLVEPRSANQLACAMIDLMADAELRAHMGAAAADCFSKKFTSEKAVENYMNIYQKLTGSTQE